MGRFHFSAAKNTFSAAIFKLFRRKHQLFRRDAPFFRRGHIIPRKRCRFFRRVCGKVQKKWMDPAGIHPPLFYETEKIRPFMPLSSSSSDDFQTKYAPRYTRFSFPHVPCAPCKWCSSSTLSACLCRSSGNTSHTYSSPSPSARHTILRTPPSGFRSTCPFGPLHLPDSPGVQWHVSPTAPCHGR